MFTFGFMRLVIVKTSPKDVEILFVYFWFMKDSRVISVSVGIKLYAIKKMWRNDLGFYVFKFS